MFTGIVQEIGIISNKEDTESGVRLEVKVSKTFLNKLEKGASISVNGVCLTVIEFEKDNVSFDDIEMTTGLKEQAVIDIMKTHLKKGSYRLWRRRVNGRDSKHRQKTHFKRDQEDADRLV